MKEQYIKFREECEDWTVIHPDAISFKEAVELAREHWYKPNTTFMIGRQSWLITCSKEWIYTIAYVDKSTSEEDLNKRFEEIGCIEILPTKDNINPSHYKSWWIECIDAIQSALTQEEFEWYLKWNILKYTWREKMKNWLEDINKSQWYIKKLINIKWN